MCIRDSAKAADDVNRLNLADLEERIKAVQNVEVSLGMDFESAETLKQQVADIAAGLAEQLVIPITLVPPPEMGLPGAVSYTHLSVRRTCGDRRPGGGAAGRCLSLIHILGVEKIRDLADRYAGIKLPRRGSGE